MSDNESPAGQFTAVLHALHPADCQGDRSNPIYPSREREANAAISRILEAALTPASLERQLQQILDVIASISWLNVHNKGAILVANSRDNLLLAAQHNLSASQLRNLAFVPLDRNSCGRAAQEKSIVIGTGADGRHKLCYAKLKKLNRCNIPLCNDQNELIGVMVLFLKHGHRPHHQRERLIRMLGQTVSGLVHNSNLNLRAEITRVRLQKAQTDMMQKLVTASKFRDIETGEHITRVSRYAATLGKEIGLSNKDVELLELATPLHDIGKIGIPDTILLKPGKLTEKEYSIMRQHTELGASMLSGDDSLMKASRQIALSHHEKWDGSGYPRGLAGEDIPLFARICCLVDVFDALTTERPYKDPWPLEDALPYVEAGAGSQFDPRLVDAFLRCLPEILEIRSLFYGGSSVTDSIPLVEQQSLSPRSVTWSDDYSLGIDAMDAQHRFLINLIDRVHDSTREQNPAAIVQAVLDMKLYTEVHFGEEEKLMREAEYPGYEQHMNLHRDFVQKTAFFLEELERYPLAATAEMSIYLMDWLIGHIQNVDTQYAEFVENNGKVIEAG